MPTLWLNEKKLRHSRGPFRWIKENGHLPRRKVFIEKKVRKERRGTRNVYPFGASVSGTAIPAKKLLEQGNLSRGEGRGDFTECCFLPETARRGRFPTGTKGLTVGGGANQAVKEKYLRWTPGSRLATRVREKGGDDSRTQESTPARSPCGTAPSRKRELSQFAAQQDG